MLLNVCFGLLAGLAVLSRGQIGLSCIHPILSLPKLLHLLNQILDQGILCVLLENPVHDEGA